MISKSHKGVPVLQIDNLHASACGVPPTVDAADKFVSYFENRFGEQWVLVGDRASGKAVIYAGDCHWEKPMGVSVDHPYPRVTLREAEPDARYDRKSPLHKTSAHSVGHCGISSFSSSHPVPLSASIRARCFSGLLLAANGNRSSSYR
jgi:hypothetical protein